MLTEFEGLTAAPHAQDSLQFEKRWLEIAYNSVGECLFLLSVEPDDKYRFVSVNEKFLTVKNQTKDQIIGKFFEEIINLSSGSQIFAKFRQAVNENKTLNLVESPIYPTGKHVGRVKITPLKNERTGQMYLVGAFHDLTTLIEKHEALKKTEQMLSLALRTSREAFIVLRLSDETILYVNDGWLNDTGFRREDVIGRTTAELNTWNNPADQRRFETELREKGLVRDFEFTYRNKANEARSGVFSSEIIEFNGEMCAFIIGHDNTERKRSEAALQASEAELRALFAAMSDVIFVFDSEGRYLKVAPTNPDNLIRSPEELVGKTVSEVFPAEQADFFVKRIRNALTEDKRESLEYSLNIKGQELWFAATIAKMTDESVVWVARDITFIKQAEKTRRENEDLYRETVENANDIIYTIDLQGRFISVNRAGELITGYTRDELRQMNFADIIAPEYISLARRNLTEKVESRSGETVYEIEIITKEGRRVTLEINSRLIKRDRVRFNVLGIARDITERKRAEEKLHLIEEQLRQSQKLESIGLLAGGIAHDFNNMLTAINGYSDLILRGLDENDSLRRMVEEIRKAGERSGMLTRQLLAFSRKQILQTKTLNINDIVTDTTQLLNRLIGEDIKLKTVLRKKLGHVEADPGQITQVLMNLSVNARDAMPKGGKLIIETNNVYLDETYADKHADITPGHYVMLAISDNGIGIDAETMKHIFEPFFTTKKVGEGTGMGLATVYGIVKQSRGSIWVYSELGTGTTFKIYLPVVDKVAHSIEPEEHDSTIQTGVEKILLVEDEDLVRNLTREILETCGYRVIEANNGSEAIKICERGECDVDLLITDVVMPEISGRDLVEHLTRLIPSLRVLYISGYTDNAIVQHGILNEGTNFIQKPFTLQAFAKKVREVLDAQQS